MQVKININIISINICIYMYRGKWSLVNFVLAWGFRLTFNLASRFAGEKMELW